MSLSNQHQAEVLLTLLTFIEDPLLRIPKSSATSLLAIAPSNTPTVAMFSPEQSGYGSNSGVWNTAANPSTPTVASFEHDLDARLVDITEETWGLVTCSTSSGPNIDSEAPPLHSGYLMKRMGPQNQDGLLTCEVCLLYAQRPCEALLKEVLQMYSSLATLARIRGIVDPLKSLLPWHIAAASKAHTALELAMRWMDD